jgi:hypothetical protein
MWGRLHPGIEETQRHKEMIQEHLHLCSSVCICGQFYPLPHPTSLPTTC